MYIHCTVYCTLYTDENLAIERRKAETEILIPLSQQSLELVRIFKEASGKLYLFFSLTRQHENVKTNYTCTEVLI
jgi:hypothetical protein